MSDSDIEIIDSDEEPERMLTDIQKEYLNPRRGLVSVAVLAQRLGKPVELVKKELSQLPEYQRTLPSKVSKRTMFKIVAEPNSYQVDIVFMPAPRKNQGFPGFLLAIEITSRRAYMFPLKTKTTEDVLGALKKFVEKAKPERISSDNESAIMGKTIQDWLRGEQIDHFAHRAGDHFALGIIDRLVRTLKEMFQKLLTPKWIDTMEDIVENYNEKPHRSLSGRSPNEVDASEDLQEKVRVKRYLYNRDVLNKTAVFAEGDKVRVLEPLGKLEKGRARYSNEVYTIVRRVGLSYLLKTANGNVSKNLRRPYELVSATGEGSVKDRVAEAKAEHKAEKRLQVELGKNAEEQAVPRQKRESALNAEAFRQILGHK